MIGVKWLESFLTNKTQTMITDDEKSTYAPVESAVTNGQC